MRFVTADHGKGSLFLRLDPQRSLLAPKPVFKRLFDAFSFRRRARYLLPHNIKALQHVRRQLQRDRYPIFEHVNT